MLALKLWNRKLSPREKIIEVQGPGSSLSCHSAVQSTIIPLAFFALNRDPCSAAFEPRTFECVLISCIEAVFSKCDNVIPYLVAVKAGSRYSSLYSYSAL